MARSHAYRRIVSFAVAGMIGAGLAGTAAADPVVWNINIFGPPRALTKGIEAVSEFYKKESGGQLDIKLHYGSALGPEKQIPESIKAAGYEGGQICAGYYPNKFPLLTVMELPFILPKDTADRAKVDRAITSHPAIIAEMAERWNVKFLSPLFLPPYEFMGNTEINSVEDMKGVKMRISGLNATALQAFGAVPTMVTAPEGYTALERGTIDSFGFPYSYTFGAYKLYEVSKYVTEGMAMGGFMCFHGVSLDSWNALPKDLQDKLPQAQQIAEEAILQAYKDADAKWIPIFHERLKVAQFPASERAKLAAGAGKIWAEWAAEQDAAGRPGTEILEFVKAEVAKFER